MRIGILYLAVGSQRQHLFLGIGRAYLERHHPELDQHIITDRRLFRIDPTGSASGPHATNGGKPLMPLTNEHAAQSHPTSPPATRPPATSPPQVFGRVSVTPGRSLSGVSSRVYKTQLNRYTPFDTTLFLDNDTIVTRRLDALWPHLDGAPLAAALDVHPTVGRALEASLADRLLSEEEAAATRELCGDNASYFNAGVMLWRRGPDADRFFAAWHEEWQRFQGRDQFALVRALARTGTPVAVLPPPFNVPVWPATANYVYAEARILHFWMRPKLQYMRQMGFIARSAFKT
jgi:hypothetical protein